MAGDRLFRLVAAGLFASVLLSACGGGGGGGSGGGGDVGDGRVAVVEDKTPPISPPTGGVAVVEDETPPIDEENKPLPPEIMKADSDSPLSPQEPVLAATESGAALLTVTISNGGELLPFTDANGFASEGGSVAVISLSRAAAALFTADGLVMSLVLTATNAGGTVLSTVSFASSALGIDGAGLTLHLTTALLRSETELFAATDASLTIWHNGDKEEKYELSGLGWDLFTVGADGGVSVADDLPVSGEGAFYGLTLRLTDGAVDAERLLSLRLTPPRTEITPPRTEAPPLPEIEGELLGETKLVDALSGSGTALLAVTVSNGGALLSFSDANGFASDGGAVAVISLARPATALFTRDNLTLSLALTATNAGGTVSETVSFASSARGFDGLGLSLHLTTALLRSGTELFAATDSRLTIWHNDGKEENYELSGLDSQLFAADADGGVRVAGDLPVSGEGAFYELTLRLTDGAAIAERLLFLRLTPPLPEIEGVSSEMKLVNALSGSGTALLAVTVSNGGALSPFADAGFASDGGAVAVISLARSATALFTRDGLALSLALTATNAGGTVSATVSFASSARGFDGLGLSLHLTTALLRSGTVLFAAVDARLTIWHNDGKKESYELSGLDSELFAAGADGEVRVASDLPVSGEGAFYELTLRLTDGAADAERLLFLRLTPPLPEIEGVSGETKLVNALSGSGTALLAVTVSNGGALSPIADANGFASGGGAVAVISLARSATALFTRDGLTLSLALTATNAGGTVSETVSFASSARGFDGLGLSLHLTTALLRPETELFAATDSRLTIWHNDGKEESYELSGLDSQLFAADADGGVRVASDLPVSGEGAFYELTLRLTDGAAIAERLLFLRLTPPLPEIEGVSGETKLVDALSRSGTALLTVTVSNGGALSPFADANGFASDGGAFAVISLARSAAALFTLDGLTLSLALTATNAGGTVSETVSFASSARGFDGLGLSLHLTTALLRPETELFAAADSRLTIWHNGGKEESYELSGLDSQLFAAGADGEVRVASDLPVSGEGAFYELTLRLTDGAAIAERLLFLRLTPPLPEIEGVSSETKLVNALSGSGTALLAVTVSNGGELSPFADANGFASGGGAVAVISLARPATALFTLDGLTLSLALTATNAGGTVSEVVSFASSSRGFDGLELSLHLTTALLRSGTELFAATDSRLTIWHNDGKEENYELSGLDSQLFAADADGGVRVAGDLPVSGEGAFYELTLRLTDGAAVAKRLLFLRLTPPPPEFEGVSSETKLVDALSGSGTALLAVTVSNGGALSPFTDANGFASGGGAVAVISLARSATALFTLDGLTLSLALTATNAGGTVSATVSFASSARGFDGLRLSLHLTTALLRPGTKLFAATDSRLTIWHNDGKEENYELSGLDSQLFVAGVDGGVRVASDLPVSGEGAFYELTLRLTDGAAIAERLLFLRLTPPLPEIEGELLGETKLVDALSGSGTALLAVTVSNGGALSPFADANGFASDGGAVAVISLARSATALFTLDGLALSLALTATNAGGTVSETVSFASSARGFDGLGLSLHLTTALLRPETELFAATDSRLTIWHNDGKEESYELSGLDSELFAAGADGGVRVASDLPVSGEGAFYELTLRLTDGAAIAERLLFLRLTPPLPEIEGVSGETKLVDALSGSGTALLAVTVSNGGALSPFADANGFASEGGAVAVISLARSATALFTLDGLTLSLALTATNAGGTVSEVVSFASSARGFDGLGLSLHLTTALLRPETELFAATDSRLTIWHNDGKEESYELSGLDSQLFAADADGEVRVAADLPVSGEGAFYELTLRLTDGAATAERLLFLRLTPPLPEIEGVSGETKLVDALSGSGTALLAVTVSNGGALSPFADANGFASDGGAVAVISLARSAAALFTLDGLTLSLALTATNAGGTVSATVSFASSALGIDGAGLFASFATVMLPSETEVFAAADARLTIWHNGDKQETYELAGADASLFAVDVNGGVRTASDLSSSEDNLLYELTLRLTDGAAIAERLLTLALLPPPIAVDVEVECTGQWPCRDQFAAALSAAIESGEATLDHGQAVVIDREGNTHGSEVRSAFQLYGSGASVSLTLTEKGNTPDAFLELPAKKKRIVAHSVNDLIASAETLEEKDAIVAQAAANFYEPFANFYRTFRRPDAPALITAAVETGLMVVVGGIAKTSERYELNRGYTEIDFDKRYTYKDYCDGTRKATSGSPPNIITLNGEEYCSIYNRCGWMQNYCLVAPAIDVVITETGQREDGTSFAAPQAAAALQMLGTMWPELSQRELALMLLELADDVGEQDHEGRDLGGIDHVYGHGVLSFRRLYEPGGLSPFIVGDEIFRFSCDADANTCQKERL